MSRSTPWKDREGLESDNVVLHSHVSPPGQIHVDRKLRSIQCQAERGEQVRGGLLTYLVLSQALTLEEIYANVTEMLLAGVDTVSQGRRGKGSHPPTPTGAVGYFWLFIYLKDRQSHREREREQGRERKISSHILVHSLKWPKQPGLGQEPGASASPTWTILPCFPSS